jgi:hypothetical protein
VRRCVELLAALAVLLDRLLLRLFPGKRKKEDLLVELLHLSWKVCVTRSVR